MISSVVEAAAPLGIPVMAEPIAFEMERGPKPCQIEADGCRVAMELGVDILKVAYPGRRGYVGVVARGAAPADRHARRPARRDHRRSVWRWWPTPCKAGANGIVIGRRVWQRPIDEAAALLEKLYAIVHSTGVSVAVAARRAQLGLRWWPPPRGRWPASSQPASG